MEDRHVGQQEYIQKVLTAYRQTPGTRGTIRRPDRLLAAQLDARGVPLHTVENALLLAASRRLFRPTEAPPLNTSRSLAYFLPVVDEVLALTGQPRLLPLPSPTNRRLLFPRLPATDEPLTGLDSTLAAVHALGVG